MIEQVSFITYSQAFAAGLLSFGSPCVLGLVPGYLSFVSGVTYDELGARARNVIWPITAFVAGFTLVFTLMGASAGLLGRALQRDRTLINRVGGTILIALGIAVVLLPTLGWLQRERKVHITRQPTTLVGAGLVGAVFAGAWTPCIGPFLGGVLTIAAPSGSPALGASLLFVYAMGLGIPFLLSGIFLTRTLNAFARVRSHWRVVNAVAAVMMIGIGLLMVTGRFELITQKLAGIGFQGI